MIRLAIPLLVGTAVAVAVTPAVRWAALRLGCVDRPRDRHIHKKPVPYLGGIAIFAAFWCAVAASGARGSFLPALFAGGFVVTLVGVVDDVIDLPAGLKFLGQVLAAGLAVAMGIQVRFLTNPLGAGMLYLGRWSVAATILWIVAITNVVNFIDGLDGLAAGVCAIAGLAMFAVSLRKGPASVAALDLAVAGAAAGFLCWNFNPARIFMGDAGAMFLGFTIAVNAVLGAVKGVSTLALTIPALALGIPILDTALVVATRLANGTPFYEAGKDHIHHRLLKRGLTQRQAVLLVYGVSALLGTAAVTLSRTNRVAETTAAALVVVAVFFLARAIGVGLPRMTLRLGRRSAPASREQPPEQPSSASAGGRVAH